MITITLGTIPFPFLRAITWLDDLLNRAVIEEPVILQHGITDVSSVASHPLVTAKPILEPPELISLVRKSRIVISHAGQGSTRMLAAQHASFVLLPRLAAYKEHVDDHQLLFAQSIEKVGIDYYVNLSDLERAIQCPPPPFKGDLFNEPKLSDYLRDLYSEDSYSRKLFYQA